MAKVSAFAVSLLTIPPTFNFYRLFFLQVPAFVLPYLHPLRLAILFSLLNMSMERHIKLLAIVIIVSVLGDKEI